MNKKIFLMISVVIILIVGIKVVYFQNNKIKQYSDEQQHKDWCSEHNMSEAECTICNPGLTGKIVISSESQTIAGIKTEKVYPARSGSNKIWTTGKVIYNEKKLVYITSRVNGRIEEISAFLQSKVISGDPLVTIYSPEYLTMQSEYIQSIERWTRAKQNNNVEEETTAKLIHDSAKQKLIITGMTEKAIVQLSETRTVQPYLNIHAPFNGTIIESNVIQGNYIQLGTVIYKLADLSTLWVTADVYEHNIAQINIGQPVEVTTVAYPGEIFEGIVTTIGDVLDEKTRNFKVRIELSNPYNKLKPEMFVKVSFITSNRSSINIPKKAVLTEDENNIVFLALANKTFQRKKIELGIATEDYIQVVNGLTPGDIIVTEGQFLLKSEVLKSKLGAGCAE